MPEESLPPTDSLETTVVSPSHRIQRLAMQFISGLRKRLPGWKKPKWKSEYTVVSVFALIAVGTTVANSALVQLWERNLQTFFFDVRGPLAPPEGTPDASRQPGIVILAMDGDTVTQGKEIYPTDPKRYAYFETIQQWPWQRTAYAIVIDRLMQAGARAVVMDVVLDLPSSYGPEDDEQLRRVIAKYPGRITLAEKYIEEESRVGYETKLYSPNAIFQSAAPITGFINFFVSPNTRIHTLGSDYLRRITQANKDIGFSIPKSISLAEAALKAAKVSYPRPKGQDIFFYGPSNTFDQIPFWHILDPQNWNGYHLKNQTFKNKIVLIGPTGGGETFQDFHLAPFSGTLRYPDKMAGVEIQANAIATLMQGKALFPLFPNPLAEGIFVGIVVLGAGYLQNRTGRSLRRFGYGIAIAGGFCIISFAIFVVGGMTIPTTVPILAIASCSFFYLVEGIIRAVRDFRRFAESREVQDSSAEFESTDLQDLVERTQREFLGRKLDGRYQVLEQIGIGGFGETYKAVDLKRPGFPVCVVKRLKPANKSLRVLKLAKELFRREAEVLERLGKSYEQIPQLLAYFDEQEEFYLVQEYIDGISLAEELSLHKLLRPLSEQTVVMLLYELMHILDYVHQQGVIHRDIKPANIIRRRSDKKLVLIDFGAVKEAIAKEEQADGTMLTVAIGTRGYAPLEQLQGHPRPASDIYAAGMTGISALTGLEPSKIDSDHGEPVERMNWKEGIQISDRLAAILDKMVEIKKEDRYQLAKEVIADLQPLVEFAQNSGFTPEFFEFPATASPQEASTIDETKEWYSDAPEIDLPPTEEAETIDDPNLEETKPWSADREELSSNPGKTDDAGLEETKPWLDDREDLPSTDISDESDDGNNKNAGNQ